MRILVNSDELAPVGGVELSSLQVCRELAGRGHQFDLVYHRGGELEGQWRDVALELRPSPPFLVTQQSPLRDLRSMPGAVRATAGLRPDVLWLNRAEHLVWGLLASRATRSPLVVHLRTHPHFPALRTMARGVSRFIAASGYIRDLWVDAGLHPDSVDVVLNGVDAADYPLGGPEQLRAARQRLGLDPGAFVVLYYGRIHPEKGLDVLLDAWSRLALSPAEATLVLAGDPYPTPEGAAYAATLRARAGAGVRWLPMQSDVTSLLHAADTVVLPAQWQEPFGRVVAEGLISGRPVVASRVGGIPEQLTGEFSRFLFDPQDTAGLAERLAGLRDWRTADPGLGDRAAAHAQERLSLRATTDGVEQVLGQVVGRRTGRPAARKVPVVAPNRPELPSAAVVICAYTLDRWDLLRASVASVQQQTVRPEQVVLVIDHNEELLARAQRQWPDGSGVQVVANRYPGRLGSARNTGVELLTADVVAFLDDDAAADPAWLETLLRVYATSDAVAVGGAPQPNYRVPRPAWFPEEFNWVYGCHYPGLPSSRATAKHLIGAAMSAWREALVKTGGFHSDNHDDMDMCHRLAAEYGESAVVYEPAATVQHTVTPDRVTWAYFWRRCFQVNRGKVLAFHDMGHAGNLSAERAFVGQMIGNVLRRLARGLRGDRAAVAQALAVTAGIGLAGLGHLVGTAELKLGRTEPSPTRGLS